MSVYRIKYKKEKTYEDLPHRTSWEWESRQESLWAAECAFERGQKRVPCKEE